tara:strand:- start:294 stop:545 length:252 start_codon:yes stop_codon:yes gene_type:complete
MSLWDNIRKRRAAGKPKLKPGDKNYPKTLNIEDVPSGASTGSIPNPADTAMGPRFKADNVTDRRRKKEMVLLKRFRKHMEDNG